MCVFFNYTLLEQRCKNKKKNCKINHATQRTEEIRGYRKSGYMYSMEYYAALKKDGDFTSFMFTWMELEHILLSKVSQEWKKKYPMYSALL